MEVWSSLNIESLVAFWKKDHKGFGSLFLGFYGTNVVVCYVLLEIVNTTCL